MSSRVADLATQNIVQIPLYRTYDCAEDDADQLLIWHRVWSDLL